MRGFKDLPEVKVTEELPASSLATKEKPDAKVATEKPHAKSTL